jgi:hypothetical protein
MFLVYSKAPLFAKKNLNKNDYNMIHNVFLTLPGVGFVQKLKAFLLNPEIFVPATITAGAGTGYLYRKVEMDSCISPGEAYPAEEKLMQVAVNEPVSRTKPDKQCYKALLGCQPESLHEDIRRRCTKRGPILNIAPKVEGDVLHSPSMAQLVKDLMVSPNTSEERKNVFKKDFPDYPEYVTRHTLDTNPNEPNFFDNPPVKPKQLPDITNPINRFR